ncbi:MAG: hypothetical protein MJY60_04090 [Bacteroidales bacterium]|nr:hypothetical protein [Bacteroidales bacterium]
MKKVPKRKLKVPDLEKISDGKSYGTYYVKFNQDQIQEKKEKLLEAAVDIQKLEERLEDAKDAVRVIRDQMKPLLAERKHLAAQLAKGGAESPRPIHSVYLRDLRIIAIYDAETGELREMRDMSATDAQVSSFFSNLETSGVDPYDEIPDDMPLEEYRAEVCGQQEGS